MYTFKYALLVKVMEQTFDPNLFFPKIHKLHLDPEAQL